MDRPNRGQVVITGRKACHLMASVFIVALLALSLAESPASAEIKRPPKGSVKVEPQDIASLGKRTWCARNPGQWKAFIPGERLSINRPRRTIIFFISYLQRGRNAASSRQARHFGKLHRKYLRKCRAVNSLRLNVRKAVGIARTKAKRNSRDVSMLSAAAGKSVASGDLQILLPSGSIRDAVTSGEAKVQAFRIASNGEVFIWLKEPILLTTGVSGYRFFDPNHFDNYLESAKCTFLKVNRATGAPTCLDRDLFLSDGNGLSTNPSLQVDSTGGIYYSGFAPCYEWQDPSGICAVLRFRAGDLSDSSFFESSGSVQNPPNDLLLLSNDTALGLIDGDPMIGVDSMWRIRPDPSQPQGFQSDGVRFTIPADPFPLDPARPWDNPQAVFWGNPENRPSWLLEFPDGNAYVGLRASTGPNYEPAQSVSWIGRYNAEQGTMDPNPWVGSPLSSTINTAAVCAAGPQRPTVFCEHPGGPITGSFSTTGGGQYLVAGKGEQTDLIKVFPNLSVLSTVVTQIAAAAGAGERALIGGKDDSGQGILTILNLATNTEKVLLPSGAGIEVTQIKVAAPGKQAFFIANRRSDGKSVLGKVDLVAETAAVTKELENEWVDFQAFGNAD